MKKKVVEGQYQDRHLGLERLFSRLATSWRKRSLMIVVTREEHNRILSTNWLRADGSCICKQCKEPYRKHPWLSDIPTLHLLCDGTWVKL